MTQEFLLGSILMQAGVISPESLSRALQLHSSSGQTLGQCLVQLGAASRAQISSAVAYQDRLRDEQQVASSEAPKEERRPAHAIGSGLRLSTKQEGYVQSMHSQVLGEVLIRLGVIDREKLDKALKVQRAANVHVGEALVETGAATWDQIRRGLEVQKRLRRAA